MENKEVLLVNNQEVGKNEPVMVDLESRRKDDELPKGVESWMTRVEKVTPKQVNDDVTGQPILTTVMSQNPVIVVPVSRSSFASGFKKKLNEAGRWLSEYLFRLIKIKKGEVKFSPE